jgi:hypothetical protein
MKPTVKRPGRPAGTDYKEDAAAFAMVADLIVGNPGMAPSAAMSIVFDSKDWKGRGDNNKGATVPRWLVKWRTAGNSALAAARARVPNQLGAATTIAHDVRRAYIDALPRSTVLAIASDPPRLPSRADVTRPLWSDWPKTPVPAIPDWFTAPAGQSASVHLHAKMAEARQALDALKAAGGASHLLSSSEHAMNALKDLGYAFITSNRRGY